MKIYHGSTVIVEKPEIRQSSRALDFGTGFYTTTSYEQAKRWALTKQVREKSTDAFVNVYEFDDVAAKNQTAYKQFKSADIEWLDFITKNRAGENIKEQYDLYFGPVADDNVYSTIRLFETGVFDAEEAVKRLKTEVLKDQLLFHTYKGLEFCKFIEAIKVEKD